MSKKPTSGALDNINIETISPLPSPLSVKTSLPISTAANVTVAEGRQAVIDIIARRDKRLLVVVGPCSIHDLEAGREYAHRLAGLSRSLEQQLLIVMRVYFEKPRTTTGWKGYINDPHLDDSFDIERGLQLARGFLMDVAELGIPTATEALDPIVPQYLGDLISWYAIGARTTESQTHREMASGLSAPCGFKNATDGNVDVAINAMTAASEPHHFLGITEQGEPAVIRTKGNNHTHLILRGGSQPNYDSQSVSSAVASLQKQHTDATIMIDCSHGNSNKDPSQQREVALEATRQRSAGQTALTGLMIESHLHGGNQPLAAAQELAYGVSITDACIDWETTEALLRDIAAEIEKHL